MVRLSFVQVIEGLGMPVALHWIRSATSPVTASKTLEGYVSTIAGGAEK